MKAPKAVKKINKAINCNMDTVIMLGLDKGNRKGMHVVALGPSDELGSLIINWLETKPKVKEMEEALKED